jgi:hypothetical protein
LVASQSPIALWWPSSIITYPSGTSSATVSAAARARRTSASVTLE